MEAPQKSVYYVKEYVSALVEFTPEGLALPRAVTINGARHPIERVKDAAPRASLTVGGHGMRYLCVSRGRELALYYEPARGKEPGRWFVEREGVGAVLLDII